MPAKFELRIPVERSALAEALKNIPIEDGGLVLFRLGEHYASDAPAESPRAKFGKALCEIIRENLELSYSF